MFSTKNWKQIFLYFATLIFKLNYKSQVVVYLQLLYQSKICWLEKLRNKKISRYNGI